VGKLVLYMPDGSTREILLTRERIRIGRRPDNDIPLPFPAVSGEHAAIVTILSDSFLEDLGSTNGTFVNGKPVTKHFLRDRDRIDVGRENFIYYVDDHTVPEPLPQELLNNRNLARPLESYRSIEADIASRIASKPKGTAKPKRVVAEVESPSPDADVSDRTTRLQTVLAVSSPVPPATKDAPAAGQAIDTQPDQSIDAKAHRAPDNSPSLMVRVITGPSAGRELPLAKSEFALGRIGVAVATLKRVGDEVWLIALEGTETPRHNGAPIPAQGAALAPGDKFEVAGTELTLVRQ
jgi:pSer/pThr/pTyr-binding forkhead associated (FHA) protein